MEISLFRRFVAGFVAAGLMLGLAASASAQITFFNVNMTGSPELIAGSSFFTGNTDIDFSFPNAVVGDFQPLRQGTITITYEATSMAPIMMDEVVLTILGGLLGTGIVQFSEVVEDMITPGMIGSLGPVTLTSNSQLPFSQNIEFLRPSTHIKVKKEFFLMANPDSPQLDLARISLVEQNLVVVPEPASFAAIGIGLAAMVARRRRK